MKSATRKRFSHSEARLSPSNISVSPEKDRASPSASRMGVPLPLPTVAAVQSELNNQAYAWIDASRHPCSPPPQLQDNPSIFSPLLAPERTATLHVTDDIHLGLLIRGGMEYGLGIYITGLDKASAAEAANLKVGMLHMHLLHRMSAIAAQIYLVLPL